MWSQDLKENDKDLGTQGFKAKKDLTIIKVAESFLIKTPPTWRYLKREIPQ